MLLRSLLVVVSGFIFIFSPGLPMNLISRYSPDYKRDLVYWGIGGWLVATVIALFTNNLIRIIVFDSENPAGYTGQPIDYIFIFAGSFISALFLGIVMLLILKFKHRKNPEHDVLANGLALGFGAGLVAQVFTGITLVGAGFQVMFGNTSSNITVEAIANSNLGLLIANILTLILFRIALLAVSAVQGILTAKSMQEKKGRFWLGVLVAALFTSIILIVQLLMGQSIPGQVSVGFTSTPISIVTGIYYLLAFIAAYYWLVKNLQIQKKK